MEQRSPEEQRLEAAATSGRSLEEGRPPEKQRRTEEQWPREEQWSPEKQRLEGAASSSRSLYEERPLEQQQPPEEQRPQSNCSCRRSSGRQSSSGLKAQRPPEVGGAAAGGAAAAARSSGHLGVSEGGRSSAQCGCRRFAKLKLVPVATVTFVLFTKTLCLSAPSCLCLVPVVQLVPPGALSLKKRTQVKNLTGEGGRQEGANKLWQEGGVPFLFITHCTLRVVRLGSTATRPAPLAVSLYRPAGRAAVPPHSVSPLRPADCAGSCRLLVPPASPAHLSRPLLPLARPAPSACSARSSRPLVPPTRPTLLAVLPS